MKHLITGGYMLTECSLTAARRAELTIELSEVTCPSCRAALINRGVCPECGAGPKRGNLIPAEEKLTWGVGWIPEGTFYLGCSVCHATLVDGVGPEMVLAALNEHRWRP
jgi:hypothetical protein